MSKYRTINRINRFLRGARDRYLPSPNRDGRWSFSERGEDLIIDAVFSKLGIGRISYLDLGANHPTCSNNTYFFYRKGCSGVLVEPDPILFAELRRRRKRDICLNVGVGAARAESVDFFLMSARTLNTFSRVLAEEYQRNGERVKIQKVIRVPVVPVNEILERYFADSPNLVSLDVEGLDLDVLKCLDFERFQPQVICVEAPRGNEQIDRLLCERGYFCYANTWVNSIFVSSQFRSRL
jgi:FkbM family methyltransferase